MRRARAGARLAAVSAALSLCAANVGASRAADVGASRAANAFDAALYAELLERHTREVADTAGVRVDYRALRGPADAEAAAEDWERLLASLERVDPDALAGRAERMALFINAYNIFAIDVVLESYPVESIRDAGSFFWPVWKREAGRIGGRAYTLDEIEHDILRPMGDPRVHAAVVCASTSCPSLRREPYLAERLSSQLDDAAARWLADPQKGLAIDRPSATVTVSRIFDWFEEDFEASGGVLAFVTRHAPPDARAWLEENGADARLRHFDYDWSLNDLAGAERARARR